MKPPIEPTKDDCCDSGCNPCIFDVYDNQVRVYEKYLQDCNSVNLTDYGISQLECKIFYVHDVVQISSTHKIIYFQKSNDDPSLKVWWKPGDHFLIKYTSANNVSCTRAYTPVKLKMYGDCSNKYDFLIVVKKCSNGLVSNYLFNLTIGQETRWRGPYGTFNIQPNKYSRIIMIAQGTGIAPFISIIQNILNNEEDMTVIVLCYCCKDIIEILFRDELYEFNSYWNFSYKIFLSNSSYVTPVDKKYNEPLVHNKFTNIELDSLNSHANDQYLLCGSIKFMKDYEAILKNRNHSNIFLF